MRSAASRVSKSTVLAGAGAAAAALLAPFEQLGRYDYALAGARTRSETVWSKAMAARLADVFPRLSPGGDLARRLWASRYIWAINTHAEPTVIVYVCNYGLAEFFDRVLPHLARRVAIVTGDGDLPVFSSTPAARHLEDGFPRDRRVHAVFAQNLDTLHPRAFPLPIGLDFHTVERGTVTAWGGQPGRSAQDQEDDLMALRDGARPWIDRHQGVYVQFSSVSNVVGRTLCLRALSRLSSSRVETRLLPRIRLWRDMAACRFVASPPGNGLDCHRTWEALVLGCVPIVERVAAMSPVFADLPVWEVGDYAEVTQASLDAKSLEVAARLAAGEYRFDRLKIPWWRAHLRTTVAGLAPRL